MIEFPFFNMQQLNLDWIIDKIKGMLPFLPDDGTVGQILRRTADGAEWSDETGNSVESVNGKTGAVVLDADDILMNDNSSVEDSVSDLKSAIGDIVVGNVPVSLVPNQYVKNTDGSFDTYNGWSRTDYIYVGNLSEITIDTTVRSAYNYFYDAAKTPIKYFVVCSGSNKVYLDPDVAYIALSNTNAAMGATAIKIDASKTDARIESLESVQDSISENVSSNVLKLVPKVETSNGITVTVTEDTIRVQGTATENAYFYDFFNVADFVGAFTFGVTELSGTGFRRGDFLIQIPYNNNISNGQSKYFAEAPSAQIVAISGKTIDTTIRFWANKGWSLHDYEPSELPRVPNGALECAEYNSGSIVYKCPDVADAVYKSEFYYGISDGVITLNGELTQGGFTLNLPPVTLSGYNTVNIEVLGGSYTGTIYLLLPTGQSAFFTNLGASTQRLEYFDGTEKTVAVYAQNGAVCSNFRFRLWIVSGLSNKPFDADGYSLPVQNVVACTAGEYNAPTYARIDDGVLYSVFGVKHSSCKNGMIGRDNTSTIAKFALFADLHYTDNEAFYTRIYKKIASSVDVDFCLMLGDVIDSGYYYTPALYQQQMAQFKNSIKYLGCPNFPFNGNHDDDVNEFAHHGVVDYGPVRFIYFWADYDGVSECGKVKSSELTWLEQQLTSSTASINIIMCHYAVSTASGFNYYIADADQRQAIADLADEHGVKLYLNGHEHDHDVSVGTVGDMTDINLPNGKYAYCLCTIDSDGLFTLVVHKADDDSVLKTITVQL